MRLGKVMEVQTSEMYEPRRIVVTYHKDMTNPLIWVMHVDAHRPVMKMEWYRWHTQSVDGKKIKKEI